MKAVKIDETYKENVTKEESEKMDKEKVIALIFEVTQLLGFTLKTKADDTWHFINMNAQKGTESIHLISGSYHLKDRIKILGNFPKTERGEYVDPYEYGEKRHSITVSVEKNADQIAKDIERRFLPRYRELLKRSAERVNRANEYAHTSTRNLERVKGTKLTNEEIKDHRFWLSGSPISVEVKVTNEDADLEIRSIPIEIASRIMRLIEKSNVN